MYNTQSVYLCIILSVFTDYSIMWGIFETLVLHCMLFCMFSKHLSNYMCDYVYM